MTNTHTLQKIVVATDGSLTARNAATVAIQIAQAEALLIEGLYIVDEPLILDPYTDYVEKIGVDPGITSRASLIKWFEKRGNSALDQLQQQCASQNVPVVTKVLLGGIPDVILEKVDQVSFLALGRRGDRHDAVTDHLGENFRQIAHHAQVPLIVGGDKVTPIKRIFLIYDGGQRADIALRLSLQLTQALSATLIVGVTDHSHLDSDFDALLFRLTKEGIHKDNVIDLHSKPVETVVEAIAGRQSDLIIMSSYRRPDIMEWLVGSPNDQILRQSPLPAVIA